MGNIGLRIREARQKQGLTLEQAAHATGLSASFLSQIERGIINPSINSLKKISQILGVSMVAFFQEDETNSNSQQDYSWPSENIGNEFGGLGVRLGRFSFTDKVRIVRSDRRKRLAMPGLNFFYELLTPDLNCMAEVLYVKASPEDYHSNDEKLTDPPGDKFFLLLKGRLEVEIDTETHVLETGDSLYAPAHLTQRWRGLGDEMIEAILIFIPPSF